jgi:hypothetical protein
MQRCWAGSKRYARHASLWKNSSVLSIIYWKSSYNRGPTAKGEVLAVGVLTEDMLDVYRSGQTNLYV